MQYNNFIRRAKRPAFVVSIVALALAVVSVAEAALTTITLTGTSSSRYSKSVSSDTLFDATQYTNTSVSTSPKNAIGVEITGSSGAQNIIWDGGIIKGSIPQSWTWKQTHDDLSGAGMITHNNGFGEWRYVRIHNVEDGVKARETPEYSNKSKFLLRDCYMTAIRDDAIDNDRFEPGTVQDCLFDGIHTFISEQNENVGSNDPIGAGEDDTIYIKRSYVRLYPTNAFDPVNDQYHGAGKWFKWQGRGVANHKLVVSDSVFAIGTTPRSGWGSLDIPSQVTWSGSNNYILWLGTPGNYKGPKPSGATFLEGASAINKWITVRNKWLTDHGLSPQGFEADYSPFNAPIQQVSGGGGGGGDTTDPTISLAAPAAGATVSGTISVTATASDNVGVVGVQFKRDGVNLGTEDTTAPYSTSWNTTAVANGSHTLTATARDAAGNTKTASVITVTVSNTITDGIAPTVPTGLVATAISSSIIDLAWTASTDNVGVTGYKVFRNGTQVATVTGTSYPDTGLSPSTTYIYTVSAYDAAGNNSAQSASKSATTLGGVSTKFAIGDRVKVSSGPLNVRSTPNGTILGTQATGNTGTIVDGPFVGNSNTWWNINYDAAPDGWSVEKYLEKVTIDATDPTISLAAPAAGATVSGTISVTATASDNVGVVGVQFKRDGVNLGTEDTTAPYSTSWNTTAVANGSHTLTAVARDAAGNVKTSAAVTVTVSNADTTPPTVPTGLSATAVSSSQINLAWTASTDNIGVTGYRLERCQGTGCTSFAQIATPTGTTYSNTGLSASTVYVYRVRAVDAAGNLSGYGSTASATTQSSSMNTITLTGTSASRYTKSISSDTLFDASQWTNTSVSDSPKNSTAVDITSSTGVKNIIWNGGIIKGSVPTSWTWREVHDGVNGTGFGGVGVKIQNSGLAEWKNLRVHNVEDGMKSRENPEYSNTARFYVHDCYMTAIRDDAIEDDRFEPGTVENCLIDGTFTFMSEQNENVGTNDPIGPSEDDTIYVKKTYVRLYPTNAFDGGVEDQYHGPGKWFKWQGRGVANHKVAVSDSVFAVGTTPRSGWSSLDIPSEVTWVGSNNFILWLGATGGYKGPKPGGVTFLEGQAAKDKWVAVRNKWLTDHGLPAQSFEADYNPFNAPFGQIAP